MPQQLTLLQQNSNTGTINSPTEEKAGDSHTAVRLLGIVSIKRVEHVHNSFERDLSNETRSLCVVTTTKAAA